MLNLITSPFLATFSDNPIPIEIEAGDAWQNPITGTTWGYWIIFANNAVPAGSVITFNIYGLELTVTVLPTGAVIPDSGLFVVENVSTAINTWITATLLPTINQNYHINTEISFVVTGNTLFINAAYETQLSVTCNIPGTTTSLIGVGTPEIYPANYNIVLDVYVTETGAIEKKVAQLKAVPQKEEPYLATFNLSGILQSFVKHQRPEYLQTDISVAFNSRAYVRFEFSEGYGTPMTYQKINKDDFDMQFILYKGGVPFQDFPKAGTSYPLIASNHWLTWKPTTLTVSKKQHEYLYWLPIYSILYPGATITAQLQGQVYFSDGTFQDVIYSTGTFYRYQVYIIPVGYEQLSIGDVNPSKTVTSWTVYLYAPTLPPLSGGYIVSPTQTYQLPNRCAREETFFLFSNSLCGFDTLRCTTYLSGGMKVTREEFQPVTGWDYSPSQGESIISKVIGEKRGKLSTGFVSLDYIKYLQEFFISPEIYIIEDENYIPVSIVPTSIELYDSGSNLYALAFEFQYMSTHSKYANPLLLHP